jgi:hypothetical protein
VFVDGARNKTEFSKINNEPSEDVSVDDVSIKMRLKLMILPGGSFVDLFRHLTLVREPVGCLFRVVH